jgi:hypothetical protein
MNETAIRSMVDDLVSAWNSRDMVGHGAVRGFSESLLRAFPDFSYRVREPICIAESGTRCVIPWEIRATHSGYFDYLGLAPTQQVITMQGVDVLEVEGVKITRIDTLFNVLPALEQALRLKPLSGSHFTRMVAVWLQRCRAYWLRHTTRGR